MTELASTGQLRAAFIRWTLVLVPGILLLGFLSGRIAGAGQGNPWFDGLTKPSIYPPPAAFGIVWSILYVLMGLALAMVVAARGARWRRPAIAGDPAEPETFMGAVIDAKAFAKHRAAIADARAHPRAELVVGGGTDDSVGWFVEPTIIETRDADFPLLAEELFGPILTVYVYPDAQWADTLRLVDRTGPYALTGAVFATDRTAIAEAGEALRYAAGNFYVNDKPTGAVVGQQPFGGARSSGTNDKAGSVWNLIRWVSPLSVKETLSPPTDWSYPFLAPGE